MPNHQAHKYHSIRNKFDQLIAITKRNVDVLMMSETESFPFMQFNIDGYTLCRSDRSASGGGILVYVQDDIPRKSIPMRNSTIEGFSVESNLRKEK